MAPIASGCVCPVDIVRKSVEPAGKTLGSLFFYWPSTAFPWPFTAVPWPFTAFLGLPLPFLSLPLPFFDLPLPFIDLPLPFLGRPLTFSEPLLPFPHQASSEWAASGRRWRGSGAPSLPPLQISSSHHFALRKALL